MKTDPKAVPDEAIEAACLKFFGTSWLHEESVNSMRAALLAALPLCGTRGWGVLGPQGGVLEADVGSAQAKYHAGWVASRLGGCTVTEVRIIAIETEEAGNVG